MHKPLTVTFPAPLQSYLFDQFRDLKKLKVKQWLKFGSVLVNDKVVTRHDHPLAKGDVVTIRSKVESQSLKQLPRKFRIVFEDDDIIVIDKPTGLLSIASVAEQDKTAYIHLTDYVRGGDEHSDERVFIVHRLDRETSGLMVFARTEEAKQTLQENWDDAEKHYFAVVEGCPKTRTGTLHSYLDERNPHHVYSVPRSEFTREAITHFEVVKSNGKLSLIKLRLETGRRHQIRVQLTELGHPIIGDEKYGSGNNPADRMGLHATYLSIPHPETGEIMEFESPLPPVLAELF